MSFEQPNMPLTGDVLDGFVTIFRELISKVSVTSANCRYVRSIFERTMYEYE